MTDSRSVPAPLAPEPQASTDNFLSIAQGYWVNRLRLFAHRLAESRITPGGVVRCLDCGREQVGQNISRHAPGCAAGQVLHCLEQIREFPAELALISSPADAAEEQTPDLRPAALRLVAPDEESIFERALRVGKLGSESLGGAREGRGSREAKGGVA